MKKNELLRDKQPFGVVYNTPMHPTMGNPAGMTSKPLGAEMIWASEGVDQTMSFANKAPGAKEFGNRNQNNPFEYVGHSFKSVATFVPLNANPF